MPTGSSFQNKNQLVQTNLRSLMTKQILLFILVLSFTTQGFSQKSEIFQKDGYAIRGYDAVAFHTEGKAIKGDTLTTYYWKDATWLFSSKTNLEKFAADPEKYAPQYGGYCAYGASDGHKAPTETDTWTIDHEKLYFNYNKRVQASWNKDRSVHIEKANKNWQNIKDKE